MAFAHRRLLGHSFATLSAPAMSVDASRKSEAVEPESLSRVGQMNISYCLGVDLCMAIKTLSVDEEADQIPEKARRVPGESFSKVIKRASWRTARLDAGICSHGRLEKCQMRH